MLVTYAGLYKITFDLETPVNEVVRIKRFEVEEPNSKVVYSLVEDKPTEIRPTLEFRPTEFLLKSTTGEIEMRLFVRSNPHHSWISFTFYVISNGKAHGVWVQYDNGASPHYEKDPSLRWGNNEAKGSRETEEKITELLEKLSVEKAREFLKEKLMELER